MALGKVVCAISLAPSRLGHLFRGFLRIAVYYSVSVTVVDHWLEYLSRSVTSTLDYCHIRRVRSMAHCLCARVECADSLA